MVPTPELRFKRIQYLKGMEGKHTNRIFVDVSLLLTFFASVYIGFNKKTTIFYGHTQKNMFGIFCCFIFLQ